MAAGQEERRRIGHRQQPPAGHLEERHLAGGAEAVLHRPDHPVVQVALSLEVEHRVHDVLQRLGTGDGALLGDVADEEHRNPVGLRQGQAAGGALADLADAPRRRLQRRRVDRLDRVHDEGGRGHPDGLLLDPLQRGLGHDVELRGGHAQPLAPQLDLAVRLLARNVQHRSPRRRQRGGDLQQQGGLAHPGLPADEHQRAGHDAAAQHPVELGQARRLADAVLALDLIEPARAAVASPDRRRLAAAAGGGRRRLLHQTLPRPAPRAAAQPLGAAMSAALTDEFGGKFLCHVPVLLNQPGIVYSKVEG